LFVNDEDDDDYSDDEYDSSDLETDVQEVPIHKINVNHSEFKNLDGVADRSSNSLEEKIIEKIFKLNNNKKKEARSYRKEEKYKMHEVRTVPEMCEQDVAYFTRDDENEKELEPFKIQIYAQLINKRPALMTAYGVQDVSSQSCHTLTFHYRKGEIFVLTTNQAWTVVQWCSDFSFPGKNI
jgi:hypothetical protein